MKIIAFGHRRRVGKDTAAKTLFTFLTLKNKSTYLSSFATSLKATCYNLYNWAGLMPGPFYEVYPELKEAILPKIGMSPRDIWIKFGTRVAREVYYDTWIKCLLRDEYLNDKNNNYADFMIIQDLRFPNEADAILATGGQVYKIERSIPDQPNQIITNIADDSLNNYQRWTGIIQNNSTLAAFQEQIEKIGESLL